MINTWSATLVLLNEKVKNSGEDSYEYIFKKSNDQIKVIISIVNAFNEQRDCEPLGRDFF